MRAAALPALTLLLASTTALVAADAPQAVMPKEHLQVFNNYCFECHDSDVAKGDVVLDDLPFEITDIETAERWQKVLNTMNSGEMPPEKKDQPTAEEKTAFLEDLSLTMVVARDMLSDSGGEITMRRLNRREYENTLRELLGVQIEAEELPSDGGGDQFDTAGGGLFFSSDQFEQYLKVAARALDQAIVPGNEPKRKVVRRESEEAATKLAQTRFNNLLDSHERAEAWRASNGKSPREFGFIDEDRVKFEDGNYRSWAPTYRAYLDHPKTKDGALLYHPFQGSTTDTTTFSKKDPPGRYILRIRAGALKSAPENRKYIELGFRDGGPAGELSVMECRKLSGTWKEMETLEIPITLTEEGPRAFSIRERVVNSQEGVRRLYFDAAKKKYDGVGLDPTILIDWVEVEGPIHEEWPPKAQQQIFFKGLGQDFSDGYARQILERFAKRAFRDRAPEPHFIDRLMGLYREHKASGKKFVECVKEPLAVILASPGFLYLAEPVAKERRQKSATKEGRVRLTPQEFAVRLSYFLWSAPPDTKLMRLAREGELMKPAILRREVNRMLADERSADFVSGFAHQWLHMERLDFFQFNYRLYPTFDDSAKAAARQEVYATLLHLLQNNLPIGQWLSADYVVINDLLGDYYGIGGVEGHQFRKVKVPPDSPRGGLLGMAAIHAMGSDGERSSPVERGAWVMRSLLHRPPPPAPANVPQLSRHADKLLPARKLLDAHMEEPQCAQCHRKIDPIGFGMENFDAAGKWRDLEIVQVVQGRRSVKTKEFPIDPEGTLPDGTAFSSFFELRGQVAAREPDFARGFTEALIAYGLGRPYGFSDAALAESILKEAEGKEYAAPSFVHALVQSRAFRLK